MQRRLIALERKGIIAALVDDLKGDVALAVERVHGRDAALQGQHLQKLGTRRDLVRLGIGCDLAEHQTLLAAPGADHVQSRFGARTVERSAQDLAVNRDNALAGLGKARHDVLKAAPKLLRLQRGTPGCPSTTLRASRAFDALRSGVSCDGKTLSKERNSRRNSSFSPAKSAVSTQASHRTEPYRAQSPEALEDHVATRCQSEGLLDRKNTPETRPSHPPKAITKLSVRIRIASTRKIIPSCVRGSLRRECSLGWYAKRRCACA
jgi:hypothetical protein